jgi:hypothetical protein
LVADESLKQTKILKKYIFVFYLSDESRLSFLSAVLNETLDGLVSNVFGRTVGQQIVPVADNSLLDGGTSNGRVGSVKNDVPSWVSEARDRVDVLGLGLPSVSAHLFAIRQIETWSSLQKADLSELN